MMNFSDFVGKGGYIVFALYFTWEIIPNLLVLFLFWDIPGKQSFPIVHYPKFDQYKEVDRLTESTIPMNTNYYPFSTTCKLEENDHHV